MDAHLALQAEPRPPPSYSATAAQGHELAGLRRGLAPAREPDGVVHGGSNRSLARGAAHHAGWPALVFGARHPDRPDAPGRVPPGLSADRRADRLPHAPAWADIAYPGPHHPEPPGRDPGSAPATVEPSRRPRASLGGQHGPQALRAR